MSLTATLLAPYWSVEIQTLASDWLTTLCCTLIGPLKMLSLAKFKIEHSARSTLAFSFVGQQTGVIPNFVISLTKNGDNFLVLRSISTKFETSILWHSPPIILKFGENRIKDDKNIALYAYNSFRVIFRGNSDLLHVLANFGENVQDFQKNKFISYGH